MKDTIPHLPSPDMGILLDTHWNKRHLFGVVFFYKHSGRRESFTVELQFIKRDKSANISLLRDRKIKSGN